jgi:hypothetical protein
VPNLARFTINGSASSPGGFDATNGQVLTFGLEAAASLVQRWTLEVYTPSDTASPRASKNAPQINLVGATTGPKVDAVTPGSNITTTAPPSGAHSYIVRSTVNGGLGADGRPNPDFVFERLVAVRAGGRRKIVASEGTQYETAGWAGAQNDDVDVPIAGGVGSTSTTATFVQPAVSATVTVSVGSSLGFAIGMVLFVEGGGYYSVDSVGSATSVVLRNLGYNGNTAPGSNIVSPKLVVAGGLQGAAGAAGAAGTAGAPGVTVTNTTANFTQPAVGATVSIAVASTSAMVVGSIHFVPGGGYYEIAGVASSTAATFKNLGIAGFAAPGATINSGAQVGPVGALGAPFVDLVRGTDLTDADQTLTVAQGNVRVQPAGSTTANRTKTLSPTGAVNKEVIRIDNLASHNLIVVNGGPGAGTLYTILPGRSSDFGFDGTNWAQGNNSAVALTPGTPGPTGPTGATGAQGIPGLGINWRVPRTSVRVKSTANVNIASPGATHDGITLSTNQVILLGNQTTPAENGLYIYAGSAVPLTRISSFEACYATGSGCYIYVREGTAGAGTAWFINSSFAVTAASQLLGLALTEYDIEDFWVPADGVDYSPAFHRAQQAMRCNNAQGTLWVRRQASYRFATPLLFTTAMALKGCGGTLKNPPQLNFTKSGAWILGGRREHDDALTNAGGTVIEDLLLLGPSSTVGGNLPGLHATCQIFTTNLAIQQFPGRGVTLRASTSEDYGSVNTTLSAGFNVPAVGSTVTIQLTSGTGISVGTVLRIATAGYYLIEAVLGGGQFTAQNIGFAHATAYAVANAAAATAIANGSAVRGVFTNVDVSSMVGGNISLCGLSGLFISGDNANAMYFRNINITSNGLRTIKDDNHGCVDRSFLGNTFVQMHAAGNTGFVATGVTTTANFNRPEETIGITDYLGAPTVTLDVTDTSLFVAGDRLVIEGAGTVGVVSIVSGTQMKANFLRQTGTVGDVVTSGKSLMWPAYAYLADQSATSAFIGCYSEASDVSRIDLPSSIYSGRIGNVGTAGRIAPSTSGWEPTTMKFNTKGKYRSWFSTGARGSDEIHSFAADGADAGGYITTWDNTRKAYVTRYQNSASYEAEYLTGTGHGNSVGFRSFPRGLLIGAHRVFSSLLANLPTVSTETGTTNPYNMGSGIADTIIGRDPLGTASTGWLYKCVKSGTTLTWQPDRLALRNVTINFGSSVADAAEVTATTTLTPTAPVVGAVVGDNAVCNPRAALPAKVLITSCRVSAADTIEIRLLNLSGSSQNLSATTWDITVFKS